MLLVLVLVFAAQPVIAVLGGAEYAEAAPVLQIQAVSLLGAFLTQAWIVGLVAIRRSSALIVMNVVALACVIVAGAASDSSVWGPGRRTGGADRRDRAGAHGGRVAGPRPA